MKIGFIGLGNMGLNMVKHLIDDGHSIVAWNRSDEPRNEAEEYGATVVENIKDIPTQLDSAVKIIFSMVAAGPVVDSILFENGENSIMEILSAGDIFIDGVNSHYKQSIERAKKLNEKGIQFVDAGISGGIEGARNGACAMVGCSEETWSVIEPLFKDLTIENGYERFGNNGAGHFVKMVHNAIEYGMMQVIGEGMNLINSYEEDIDEHKLLKVWNNGSIIESKLLGFLHKALENKEVEDLPSKIGSLGTGKWAVEDALERNIPLTAIAHAVSNRFASRDSDSLAFKIIQAMRAEFGGHDSKQQ